MPTVTKLLDPSFKSGVSEKNGKPWTLCKVEVDNKIEATAFAPIAEGDEVDLKYNDQFKNYSAEKVTQKSREQNEIKDLLIQANQKLDRLLGDIKDTAKEFNAEPDNESLPF